VCVKDVSRKAGGYASDRKLNLVDWTFCTDLPSANPSSFSISIVKGPHPRLMYCLFIILMRAWGATKVWRAYGKRLTRIRILRRDTVTQSWFHWTNTFPRRVLQLNRSRRWKTGRGEFAAHELTLSRSESLPAHDDVVVTSSSSLPARPCYLVVCIRGEREREKNESNFNEVDRWSNLGIFKCRPFESHYFTKKEASTKKLYQVKSICTRSISGSPSKFIIKWMRNFPSNSKDIPRHLLKTLSRIFWTNFQ